MTAGLDLAGATKVGQQAVSGLGLALSGDASGLGGLAGVSGGGLGDRHGRVPFAGSAELGRRRPEVG